LDPVLWSLVATARELALLDRGFRFIVVAGRVGIDHLLEHFHAARGALLLSLQRPFSWSLL